MKLPYDPTIPLLSMYPVEIIIEKDTCTPVFEVSQVALVVNNPPANAAYMRDMGSILGWEDPLQEAMATHSSIIKWRISWTEEPIRLQSIGSQKVRHN